MVDNVCVLKYRILFIILKFQQEFLQTLPNEKIVFFQFNFVFGRFIQSNFLIQQHKNITVMIANRRNEHSVANLNWHKILFQKMLCVSRKQFLLTRFSNIIPDDNNVWVMFDYLYSILISRSFVKFHYTLYIYTLSIQMKTV